MATSLLLVTPTPERYNARHLLGANARPKIDFLLGGLALELSRSWVARYSRTKGPISVTRRQMCDRCLTATTVGRNVAKSAGTEIEGSQQ